MRFAADDRTGGVSSVVLPAYDRRVPVTELPVADPTADDAPPRVGPDVRRRLLPQMPTDTAMSWLVTAGIAALAAVLRLIGLGSPKGKIFDEIYYATDAHHLMQHAVEWDDKTNAGSFVAHPPLGKWIIGLGETIFGYSGNDAHPALGWLLVAVAAGLGVAAICVPAIRRRRVSLPARCGMTLGAFGAGFAVIAVIGVATLLALPVDRSAHPEIGWRIMSVVAGVISVVVLIRVTRRMLRSTVLGAAAGLLMTLDGMAFVSSRVALLDIFLTMFVLASFACLVADRDSSRRRWLGAIEAGLAHPRFRIRGWRLAAALLLACAMAVKWSALWFIVLFPIMIYLWEAHTRRSAGVRHPWRDALLDEIGWIVAFGATLLVVYLACWAGWFSNDRSWDRHWLLAHGHHEPPMLGSLYNLFQYHLDMLNFHTHLHVKHNYQSWPAQWLTLSRPVAYSWSQAGTCGASRCASEVLLLGTPVLWWSFTPALIAVLWRSITKRDWRGWAILAVAAAGILPWVYYQYSDHRTMFYFYALPSEPFLIMAVVLALGMVIGGPSASRDRRVVGSIIAGAYVAVVALCFLYFYPIYVGESIPYSDWYARMWLGNKWI